jgi:hypothetical protein
MRLPRWLTRMLPGSDSHPVERVAEAAHAKVVAETRLREAEEVVRIREHVIIVNHIAPDIGRAYQIANGRKT